MEIQTERCIIRDFIASDIDSFMEYRNNMDWMRYQTLALLAGMVMHHTGAIAYLVI